MMNSIKTKKESIKKITFFVDLITPLLLFLALENGKSVLTTVIFFAMVLVRALFVLA